MTKRPWRPTCPSQSKRTRDTRYGHARIVRLPPIGHCARRNFAPRPAEHALAPFSCMLSRIRSQAMVRRRQDRFVQHTAAAVPFLQSQPGFPFLLAHSQEHEQEPLHRFSESKEFAQSAPTLWPGGAGGLWEVVEPPAHDSLISSQAKFLPLTKHLPSPQLYLQVMEVPVQPQELELSEGS